MDEQMGALVVFWLVPRPDVGLEALVGQYLYVQVWGAGARAGCTGVTGPHGSWASVSSSSADPGGVAGGA